MTEWISVKDRLPNSPLESLVITNGVEKTIGWYCLTCCSWHAEKGTLNCWEPTHWMPLPKLPKES